MYDTEEEVAMPWTYDDGGHSTSGFKGKHGNGVVRAIAIATQRSYDPVYRELYVAQCEFVNASRSKRIKEKGASISQIGVWPEVSKAYLLALGWAWTPTMSVGSGARVHLTYEEIPDIPLFIARVSRNLVPVINGVAHDTVDPSRDGTRTIYGYFQPGG